MHLRRQTYYAKPEPALTIQDAVQDACRKDYDTRGVAAMAQQRVDNAAEILGRLITVLHESGRLSSAEVLKVVGEHHYEECEA